MKNLNNHNISSISPINPVKISERISSVDIIRGVALLGILMINIEMFATPFENLVNPLLSGNFVGINYYLWLLKEFIFTTKMWSLFTILFGAGAYLLITRAENKGKAAGIADIYYRRLFWLLLFALIHAYLIWSGDILFFYAVTGLFLYPVRKLPVWGMLIAVTILLLISMLIAYLEYSDNVSLHKQVTEIETIKDSGKELTEEQQAVLEKWKMKNSMYNPEQVTLQKKIETMSKGSYFEIIESEKEWVRSGHAEVFYHILFVQHLMMMILGMALMKSGVLSAKFKNKTYLLLMAGGYIIGFSLVIFRIQNLLAHDFGLLSKAGLLTDIERITVAIGHIGLICLFCKLNIIAWLKKSLAAVGRMAFTNYIMQSLICIFLFYGYGFGFYGSMDRTEQLWIVAAIWLFQLIASSIWLKYFRFGPLEWVWRSLTYWLRQPMIAQKK